jgi:predicted amidohydrolase YtcJ
MKLYKGNIVTCDSSNNVFKYLVEDKGKILFVGDKLPGNYNIPASDTIDLGEKALLPSFGDGHLHFSNWCIFSDVREAKDIKDMLDRIQKIADSDTGVPIVLIFGHSKHSVKEKRLVTRKELDTIRCTRPIFIVCYDGHSAIGNSKLMDNYPEEIKKLHGFDIEKGHLFHEAYLKGTDYAASLVPTMRLLKYIFKGVDKLAENGISMAHAVEGVGFPKDMDVDLVRTIAKGADVNFRIFFQTMDVKKVLKRKMPRIGGCFATALDGCFGATDAALLKPYTNDPKNSGILYYSDEQVIAFAKEANRAGLQIEFHAIGDAAVSQAVKALDAALKDFPRNDHRHTIIHACLIAPADLTRIAELKIGITLQPAFLISPLEPESYLKKILGDRAMKGSPMKKMIEMGIHLSGGSDAPVTPPDPIEGIYAACNYLNPAYSVSIAQALRMFTYEVAYTGFDEKERGTLETGKIADMVILNKNPLKLNPKKLRELKVEKLYLKGKPYKGGNGIFSMLAGAVTGKNKKI